MGVDESLADVEVAPTLVEETVGDTMPIVPSPDKTKGSLEWRLGAASFDEICEEFGFARLPNGDIQRVSDAKVIGRIKVAFKGRTLFASCKMHPKCSNLVD